MLGLRTLTEEIRSMSKFFDATHDHYKHRLERMRSPLYRWKDFRVFLGIAFIPVYIVLFILAVMWLGS